MTTHDIGRHLHCYGVVSVVSPNLDAMAADGVLFTQAFATAPQCSPSRASLATGLYPHNNGVMGLAHRGFDWELAAQHAAALFSSAGFATYLFGGQHVTRHPDRLGFDAIHPTNEIEAVIAAQPRDRRMYIEINFDETHRPYPPAGEPPARLPIPRHLPAGPEAGGQRTALGHTPTPLERAGPRAPAALGRTH